MSDLEMSAKRILVIDDDQKLCGLIADYLTPLGYHVEARHNGQRRPAGCKEEEWEALILDVMMPGMDGFEVLRELRKSLKFRS